MLYIVMLTWDLGGKEERKGDGLIVLHLYMCHIDKGSVVPVDVFNLKQHSHLE